MRVEIKKILDNVNSNLNKLEEKLLDDELKLDETDINIEIKHILEDMRSILDYIAVDIYKKYCNNIPKKIYFIYSRVGENETQYLTKMNKNFPGLYDKYPYIYKLLSNVQSFNDNSNWLVKLNDLTNEVKHNNLYISKVEKEKHTLFQTNDTSMQIVGNMSIQKNGNGYGIFGTGNVYVGGKGNVSFYGNGIIQIGSGSYNINNGETRGIKKDISFINVVKSKKYDENIISILKLIINREKLLILNVENYIWFYN